MKIGVVALQGAVSEHVAAIEAAAAARGTPVECVPVRSPEAFATTDGLVLPGGESTTISKLLRRFALLDPIRDRVADEDYPILGTCAGMVLLAREGDIQVTKTDTELIGVMDMAVDRNAFGRQRESFEAYADVDLPGVGSPFPSVFIRAPEATRTWGDARAVATYEGRTIGVRQGRRIALSFHPELTPDTRVHEAFLSLVDG